MAPTIIPADPDNPAIHYCWREYFALLAAEIPDLPPGLFPLPDPHAASYRPPQGALLLACQGDTPLGTVALRPLQGQTAEVKRLWVAPAARSLGLARRLMLAIEDQARALGYTALNLDTNAALTGALMLYAKTGWTPIPPYSGPPSTHWFTKTL